MSSPKRLVELRHRSLPPRPGQSRILVVIAALMAFILVVAVLSAGTRAAVRARLDSSMQREVLIRRLAARFGGDRFAEQTARVLAEAAASNGGNE